jgi:18S rRNA (adenine1779-N6/adenine1780-N6)-dimethyltransferase
MGKVSRTTRNNHKTFGPIFNKELGQHILKNPLLVNSIVEKVACSFTNRYPSAEL